ncbi:P8 protein [Yerba mate virus A]|uniref:P8 protein n=1 Tax=Yerba mate virus A TaxID=2713499 RepID=A0A6G6CIK2_9RHAB|nr:P8 protein [Yerba mate virus A]QID92312.1 P8 protein [Yerba mate virus A]
MKKAHQEFTLCIHPGWVYADDLLFEFKEEQYTDVMILDIMIEGSLPEKIEVVHSFPNALRAYSSIGHDDVECLYAEPIKRHHKGPYPLLNIMSKSPILKVVFYCLFRKDENEPARSKYFTNEQLFSGSHIYNERLNHKTIQ